MAKGAQESSGSSQEENTTHRRQLIQRALVRAGLCASNPAPLTDAHPLSDDQRNALALQVARGRPLSEYIREEREER